MELWLAVLWVIMAISPYRDWLLENLLVLMYGALLVATYSHFAFSVKSHAADQADEPDVDVRRANCSVAACRPALTCINGCSAIDACELDKTALVRQLRRCP